MVTNEPNRSSRPRRLRRTLRIALLAVLSLATVVSAVGWVISFRNYPRPTWFQRKACIVHVAPLCSVLEGMEIDCALLERPSWVLLAGHDGGLFGLDVARFTTHPRDATGAYGGGEAEFWIKATLLAYVARGTPGRASTTFGFRVLRMDNTGHSHVYSRGVVFPYWLPTILFAIWPAIAFIRWIRTRRRFRKGECPSCGYNLTGNTSGKCPECGAPID